MLTLALLTLGVNAASAGQVQRLPRQTFSDVAAIAGIVTTQDGLGLGGVAVVLQNVDTGRSLTATSNGDGSFRFVDLMPGRYQVNATRDGFVPFAQRDVIVRAGDLLPLLFTMPAVPSGADALRELPRLPALGPKPPPLPPQPATSSTYRNLPSQPPPADAFEARPLSPIPTDDQVFEAVPNRWGYEFPDDYHRYPNFEVPYVDGHLYDPFNRNKLKGDYPIIGNQTFLDVTATSDTFADGRRLPVPSGLGSASPGASQFFGRFGQFFMSENLAFSLNLFHGDTSFRPADWRIQITPEININYLAAQENGVVNFDVRKGTTRLDTHVGLQEGFAEVKLKDLSNQYDFISLRVGVQSFTSDFRGFIFSDEEPGIRLFGNLDSNRYQFNLAYFAMLEKDTNSGLNSLAYRHQQVMIANIYRQDFIKPGYTIQASFHYNKDDPSFQYDTDNFLVRPEPIGVVTPHSVRAYYYGLSGDGHFGKLNLTHAFYQVLGQDKFNEIAGRKVNINAQMAALELSLDKDWLRYRLSFFYASGDKDPRDGTARGFDTIFDNPNFAGGFFSFWDREGIRLTSTGVGLESPNSLVPDLRTSKTQGQANFVNPGLFLYNAGVDIDITPKLRGFVNLNLLRFAHTDPLELLLFQSNIHAGIGADSGIGFAYRPPLSENIVITGGIDALVPFQGLRDISTNRVLLAVFTNVRFKF
ncbi:MAG TPA: carboxypeptidase-like regulatory domain-containing protein [Bryobacteraceae bacterium]|nr:carboxypeptidase-like regulatory domain-containing protein [Bryobacteraceae bacterium]